MRNIFSTALLLLTIALPVQSQHQRVIVETTTFTRKLLTNDTAQQVYNALIPQVWTNGAPVGTMGTNDLFWISTYNGPTNYTAASISLSNLFNSPFVTALLGANTNLTAYVKNASGSATNLAITGGNLTNVLLMGGGVSNAMLQNIIINPTNGNSNFCTFATFTGTAGNNWGTLNCTPTAAITNFNLGDTLLVTNTGTSNQYQMVIVAITNASATVSVYETVGNLPVTLTAQQFLWQPAQVQLGDTTARRVGAIFSGGSFGVATGSIGNNGGNIAGFVLMEGPDTAYWTYFPASGANLGFSALSVGSGYGGNSGQQLQIESGGYYSTLRLQSNRNAVTVRGPLYNWMTNPVVGKMPLEITNSLVLPVGSNIPWLGMTATGSLYQTYVTCTDPNSAFGNIKLGDSLIITNSGTYTVVGITNGSKTLAIYPNLAVAASSAATWVQTSPIYTTNSGNSTYTVINPLGSIGFVPLNSYNGVWWYNGVNTAAIYSPPAGDLYLSEGSVMGGSSGNQLHIQHGSLYDSIVIKPDNTISIRNGFTNNGNSGWTIITNYNPTAIPHLISYTNYGYNVTIVTNLPGLGAAGTATLDGTASDMAFTITLTPNGTPTANSTQCTVTFGTAYGTTPHCIMTPNNAAAAALNGTTQVFGSCPTAGTFTITSGSAALTATTVYKWNVMIIQ